MKRIALLFLLLAVFLSVIPSVAQEIENMRDFVSKGRSDELTQGQIDAYTSNWGVSEWQEFYRLAAEAEGLDNPQAIAQELIAEDIASSLTMYYSFVIYRTHSLHPSMRAPHYWLKDRRSCDQDDDYDYLFHFQVSARNVEHMRWYSISSWIGILIGSWNGRLKAFGTSAFTRICIGDTRICLVDSRNGCDAGASKVKKKLRLKP